MNVSYDYYPKPIEAPGMHQVIMRKTDTCEQIEIGFGVDDSAALLGLVERLVERGADRALIWNAAHSYLVAHRSQKGAEPPFDNAPQRCPTCRVSAEEHPAGSCLDRWVHSVFLGKTLEGAADDAPRYSEADLLSNCSIDSVTDRRGWPKDWAVLVGADGVAVGEKLSTTGPTALRQVATADNYALAVCRAAVSAPPWGDSTLEVRVPFPPGGVATPEMTLEDFSAPFRQVG